MCALAADEVISTADDRRMIKKDNTFSPQQGNITHSYGIRAHRP